MFAPLMPKVGSKAVAPGKSAVQRPRVPPQNARLEREAEATAIQVRRSAQPSAAPRAGAASSSHTAPHSGGRPLDSATREFFEPRFGRDFGHVRVHTDASAAGSARNLDALAYTYGSDIVFAAGRFDVSSEGGRHLLAHELAHVVQQEGGRPAIQCMPACPATLAATDPVPTGWKPYHGDSSWFHCGFRGILEDRIPTVSDPQNECFYDHSGTLVDASHPFAGCRGTPNQYDSSTDPLGHTFQDTGGIWQAGGPAFMTSRVYTLSRPIAAAIQVVETAGRVIRSVADGLGAAIARGVLAAVATVDPSNWTYSGLPMRSRRHLNVMGSLLGSVAMSGSLQTVLTNLTRRLDTFSIPGLLDELAADINQALTTAGSATPPVTAATLGSLSLLQLVEWLRVQGFITYVRPPEDIAAEQYRALVPATP